VRFRPRRIFIVVALVLVVVPLGLAAYGAIAEALFFRRHPPPGRVLAVGGRNMHIDCRGAGAPAVVFESALGGSSVDWYRVLPEVARFSRACAYDRAGAGWSDEAPLPRDPARTAQELHDLLAAAGVPAPYVLVGHSYGGYVVRVFAHRYRADTAALVLVDIATPEQFRIPAIDGYFRQAARDCRWDKLRAIFAIARLRGDTVGYAPEAVRPLYDGFYLSRKLQDDSCGEIHAMLGDGQAQVRAAGSFGDLPLAVVSAGQRELPDEESWAAWQALQRELPALSSRSTHVIADKSGHHIQFGQPEAIIGAVRDLVTGARAAR
jgi:pimeloyl-ACP methyl ester carboxylesterase